MSSSCLATVPWRASAFGRRISVAADQTRFGDTDRGQIGQHADVTGETEPAGMRQALTIDQQEVRAERQTVKGGEQREGAVRA